MPTSSGSTGSDGTPSPCHNLSSRHQVASSEHRVLRDEAATLSASYLLKSAARSSGAKSATAGAAPRWRCTTGGNARLPGVPGLAVRPPGVPGAAAPQAVPGVRGAALLDAAARPQEPEAAAALARPGTGLPGAACTAAATLSATHLSRIPARTAGTPAAADPRCRAAATARCTAARSTTGSDPAAAAESFLLRGAIAQQRTSTSATYTSMTSSPNCNKRLTIPAKTVLRACAGHEPADGPAGMHWT